MAAKKQTTEVTKGNLYPVLPLRDIVVFPHMIVPLFVGRPKSVRALEHAMESSEEILMLTQIDSSKDNPVAPELYQVGTIGKILQLLKLPDGTVKVLVEGRHRAEVVSFDKQEDYFLAFAEISDDIAETEDSLEPLARTAISQFENYVKLNPKVSPDAIVSISKIDDHTKLADTIASHIVLKLHDKQKLLELRKASERLEQLIGLMEGEISLLQTERRIRSRVKRQMEKTQREYYLTEQMKAIQKELGDSEDGTNELDEIATKIKKVKLSKEAREKAQAELKKLRLMSPMSSEATVVRNYLDWLVNIPWSERDKVCNDLKTAEDTLNQDHYGLEKVKERILEYLAVQTRVGKLKGPIMCLVGPPGVGKTSLGRSIARATGRNFVRISLGGVRDESEIRGHRRTYIGSMPGKIIQGMRKVNTSNPLFLLDEIDKMGSDWRGDPSSALLEVLDPEQNSTFNDHYLEVDYDLSDVMFVTTANYLSQIPRPLMDRMEIIRISGYTEQEKLEISKRHLIPKQFKENGLAEGEVVIDDDALLELIRSYTREAGVRNLEREIANIMRKGLKKILLAQKSQTSQKKGGKKPQKSEVTTEVKKISIKITLSNLSEFAGVARFTYGMIEKQSIVGVTTGLAWTEVGGELLTLEAVKLPGKGKMKITGKLGEVMQESIQAAASFVRSQAAKLGVAQDFFDNNDIHIHVPEGATPKDGPSAGIGMFTSIVSVLTDIPVRNDVAMTGEITLRGRVLAIGGLKEKLLAAHRGGIKTVIIPEENLKDMEEIPEIVKKDMKIVSVSEAMDVLKTALVRMPTPTKIKKNPSVSKMKKKKKNYSR